MSSESRRRYRQCHTTNAVNSRRRPWAKTEFYRSSPVASKLERFSSNCRSQGRFLDLIGSFSHPCGTFCDDLWVFVSAGRVQQSQKRGQLGRRQPILEDESESRCNFFRARSIRWSRIC